MFHAYEMKEENPIHFLSIFDGYSSENIYKVSIIMISCYALIYSNAENDARQKNDWALNISYKIKWTETIHKYVNTWEKAIKSNWSAHLVQ